MKHIINCLVENQPGVLARIVGLISGRGYNIETLNVGPTADPTVSNMTIVVPGDTHVITQVTRQLAKQVDVIRVMNMTNRRHLNRELILVRVAAPDRHVRADLIDLATLFMASIAAVQEDSVTIQMVGSREKVGDFLLLLKPYKVIDISRTGVIAVDREPPSKTGRGDGEGIGAAGRGEDGRGDNGGDDDDDDGDGEDGEGAGAGGGGPA